MAYRSIERVYINNSDAGAVHGPKPERLPGAARPALLAMTGSAIELGMAPSDEEEDEQSEHIEILVPSSETLCFDFVLDMAFILWTATFRLSLYPARHTPSASRRPRRRDVFLQSSIVSHLTGTKLGFRNT